ncbi:basement membrane-specific heparan sulfate proteoglycan core protein-like [Astatotilapia calliptera]|uniref:basement membrane-specific heparan sulfate proteoglycan core protein-like n=1 Tax=Astatotilapia calliptera TaxID=8154 RepID=UPI000E425BE4|nr:basement membrane-specific heparan sulfate proteoglycan core protein-like [Astatotilapia calliptera]
MNEGKDTDWKYKINKDGREFLAYNFYMDYRLEINSTSQGGEYQCFGRRKSSRYTKISNTVSITVLAPVIIEDKPIKPRATLTARTTIIPVGGSVTLTCSVQSSDGWKYEWFRRTQTTSEVQIRDQQNRDIRVSEGGIYSCRGTRGNPVYYTDRSDDVNIEKTFSNKVVVKQQPNWPQIFRGETITLTCEVEEGGETTEWEYEWRGPRTPTQWTHNNDVTFRVSESSSGDYMCKSRRRDDSYSSTEWSEAFTLSASTSKPRATLTAQSSVIPAGGSVTLSCSVEGSAGWKFDWFRRDSVSSKAQLMRGNEANRVISVSQGGLYHCRGGRGDPVYYTEDSSDVTVVETFPSKPTVTLQPSWPQIYSGETVTVRCEIQGGEGAQWTYEWRAAKLNTPPTSNEYRIIRATESDSGGYSCRGRRDYFFSGWSDIITLTVSSSKPRATLTAHSSVMPAGGSVTLSCSVEGSAGWKFDWFRRDSVSSKAQLMRGNEANRVISVSQGGLYHCRGGRGDPVYYTEDSSDVTVKETLRNRITVKLQHSWSQIFTGETITVRCEIQGGEGKVWKYEWTAPNTNSPPTSSEYRISRVSVSHSGDYRCRGSSDYLLTGWSDAFRLTVSSSKPRATLTAQSSVIPAGGSVTLSCSVEGSAGWKFDWFRRDSVSSKAQLMRGNEANGVISVSQGGLYHCRGGRGDPVYYTEDSSDVTVVETFPSKPTVTLQPSWPQIYSGETVTVRCEIQGGEGAQWTYEWRAAKLNTPPTSNEYRIIRATESDSGGYSCRGRRDYFFSEWSDIITLTVSSSKPRATLTAQSSVMPAGGSVTLSCSVEGSAGWKFDWFRRDSVSSKAQLMRGNEANRVISVSQGGLYHCRGGRGDPVYYTEDSSDVTVKETLRNRITVKLQHSWSQIFTGETITVRCEIQGGEGKVWKYEWTAPNTNSPPTSSEYRISRVSVSHSGDYRCRGSSDYLLTGWSDAFRLTVSSSKPRATLTAQSSVIPARGSVTLSCSVEGSAGWKFDWFRRDSVSSKAQLMRGNEANRVISVSQGGLYHCRGGRGDPVYYTEDSSDVTVVETFPSKPTVTLSQ